MPHIGVYRFWNSDNPSCRIRIEEPFKAVVRRLFPSDLYTNPTITPDAALIPEPEGPRGPGSISVRVDEHTIGYLPDEHAEAWAGPVRRVIASGLLPVTATQIFGHQWSGWDGLNFSVDVRLNLGDPLDVLPLNDPPRSPYTMLPRSSVVKVTKEDEHMAALLALMPPARHGTVFATLHARPHAGRGKSPVEVRINDRCVGQLTPQMSLRYLPMIQHFQDRGLLTACCAQINGSAVAAEVRIFGMKANEVSDEFLNGDPAVIPHLVPQRDDPFAYDLDSLAAYLKSQPLPAPARNAQRPPTPPPAPGTDQQGDRDSGIGDLTAAIRQHFGPSPENDQRTIRNLALSLASEVGQLAAEVHGIADDDAEGVLKQPSKKAAIESEIADAAICVIRLADSLNMQLSRSIRKRLHYLGKFRSDRAPVLNGNETYSTESSAQVMGPTRSYALLVPSSAQPLIDQAEDVIAGKTAEGDPPAELVALLNGLADRIADAISIDRPADAGGAVVSVVGSDAATLNALFAAARDHAIAIYEPGRRRLYNPHGSESVRVLLGGDVVIPFLTSDLLDDLVRNPLWPDPDAPFFIIERDGAGDGEYYIQTYLNDDGVYDLEYRDGSFERHFGFETSDPDLVSDAMWAWVKEDYGHLLTIVPWVRQELDS